jgi:hypothetical protein
LPCCYVANGKAEGEFSAIKLKKKAKDVLKRAQTGEGEAESGEEAEGECEGKGEAEETEEEIEGELMNKLLRKSIMSSYFL